MQSNINLAIERTRYKTRAFGAIPPEQIVDFNFAERNKYGRINQNRDAIVPLPQYLKVPAVFTSTQSAFLMMNFVADAYNDLKERLVRACRIGVISSEHPYLPAAEIVRAYESPLKLYREHMTLVLSNYNNEYLPSIESHTPVINFDQYWRNLLNFSKMMGTEFPMTFTAFQRSKKSSIFTSGLAMDIAGLPIDDDRPKADMFIDSSEWKYYSNVAKYHGFSISQNAPWILVADLKSPAMLQYMNANGIDNEFSLFATQYEETLNFELELLKSTIIDGYNNYATGYPYYKHTYVCDDYTTKNRIKHREATNLAIVNSKYNNMVFHVFYAQLRNIEEGHPLPKPDLMRVISRTKYFFKKHGSAETLRYINEQYRTLYRFKSGNTHDQQKRSKMRRDMIRSEATTEELFRKPLSLNSVPKMLPDKQKGSY